MTWRSLATRETPPFLVALFFGALAWFLTHWADRLSQAPVIEYAITENVERTAIAIDLDNLSENKAFSDLEFTLTTPHSPDRILYAEIFPEGPA